MKRALRGRVVDARGGALLLALLAAAPLACAQATGPAADPERWTWTLSFPEAAAGLVRVELRAEGTDALRVPVAPSGGPVLRNETPLPGTEATWEEGAIVLRGAGGIGLAYDFAPAQRRAGGPHEHVGADFALFRASSALADVERVDENVPLPDATLRIVAPEGWDVATPFEPEAPGTWRAPTGRAASGHIVAGPFRAEEARMVGAVEARHVRLGERASFEPAMWTHLEGALPYLAAQLGAPPARLLLVTAPDPISREGPAGHGSVVVHETADLRALATGVALAHQRFAVVEVAPASAWWLREGVAELSGARSLAASALWSDQQVNSLLHDAARFERDPQHVDARLPEAGRGSPLAAFARGKGAIVLVALDEHLRTHSGGAVGLADALRALPEAAPGAPRVDSRAFEEAAEAALGAPADEFFDSYVYGNGWPATKPFASAPQLHVGPLRFEPATAAPGEGVLVRAEATNRGTAALRDAVALLVDGRTVARADVRLEPGESVALEFRFVAPGAGVHEVQAGPRVEQFRSRSAATIAVARITTTPTTPRAMAPVNLLVFLQNDGETPGGARVELLEGARVLQRTTEAVIDPGDTDALTLPLRFDAPGARELTLRLHTAGGTQETRLVVDVLPADADLDGVPDADDRAPDDPSRGARGVPGPAIAMLAATLALAAAARERKS